MENKKIDNIKLIYEYNCKYLIEKNEDNNFVLYTLKKQNKNDKEGYFGYNNSIFEFVKSGENKFILNKYLSREESNDIDKKYDKKEYCAEKIYKIYKGLKYNNYHISRKKINIESYKDGFYINPKIDIKYDGENLQNKIAYLYDQDECIGIVNDYRNITLLESLKKNRDIVFFNSNNLDIYTYIGVNYFEEKFDICLDQSIELKRIKSLIDVGCKIQKNKIWLFLVDDFNSDATENSVILILPQNIYCKCILKENCLIIKKVFKSRNNIRGNAFIYIIDIKNINFTKDIESVNKNSKFNDYTANKNVNNDFLKMINKYKQIENEILEESKKEIQNLTYSNLKLKENGKFFMTPESISKLETWYGKEGFNVCYKKNRRYYDIGTLKEVQDDGIIVEFKDDRIRSSIPRKKGELSISFHGDEVIQQRRERAISLMENNLSALNNLSSILLGNYRFNRMNYRFLLPKREYGKFNQNQIESIEGALNTQDIFLIQGPPGTGKTSVIRKIVSEIIKKGKEALVTSYQNLAVDNVLDGFVQGNVIPYRYGTDENPIMSKICMDIVNDIEESLKLNTSGKRQDKLEEDKEYIQNMIKKINNTDVLLDDLNNICIWIEKNNGKNLVYEQVLEIKNEYEEYLGKQNNSINFSVDDLKNMFPKKFDYDLEIVESFEDIEKYIFEVNKEINSQTLENIRQKINELSDVNTFIELDDSKYQNIKLDIFNELKLVKVDKVNTNKEVDCYKYKNEIINVLDNMYDKMDSYVEDERYNKVKEFYKKIKNTPILLEEVLKKFSDIKGTTCQKAASKGFIDSTKGMNYEYVIVDEASRANPLDLLVPLVKGSKIILVGDHKQLPHMIDNEVNRRLNKEENTDYQLIDKYIKESIFGRLFNEFPKDRKIMLNIQYRMTKQIGDLISELFYDGNLKTGTDIINDFDFYKGNSLVYINVNGTQIKTKSSSYINKAECEEIIDSLFKFNESLDSCDKKATIGIISFYKSQVDLLNKEIIKTQFKNLDIQIGTVDAFQGLEKDVIFLSAVRSQGIGFISNPNRLNVALSRAKKLIVLFGNINNLKQNGLINKIIEKSINGGIE